MTGRRFTFGMLITVIVVLAVACGPEPDLAARDVAAQPDNGGVGAQVTQQDYGNDSRSVTEQQDAPIESVRIDVLGGNPPQYVAVVRVIQPNSCATFGHVQMRFDVQTRVIELAAFNDVTVGPDVSCDDAINTIEQEVPLGSDLEPGFTHTVDAGNVKISYTPEGAGPVFTYEQFRDAVDYLIDISEVEEPIVSPYTPVPGRALATEGGRIRIYELGIIAEAVNVAERAWEDGSNTPDFRSLRIWRVANVVAFTSIKDEGVIQALFAITNGEFTGNDS